MKSKIYVTGFASRCQKLSLLYPSVLPARDMIGLYDKTGVITSRLGFFQCSLDDVTIEGLTPQITFSEFPSFLLLPGLLGLVTVILIRLASSRALRVIVKGETVS